MCEMERCVTPALTPHIACTSPSSILSLHFPWKVYIVICNATLYLMSDIHPEYCETGLWVTKWKKKILTNALSPHKNFIHTRGLWIFISCNIYTKLAYLVMKYFPLLVNSSKIDQLSKERETLKVPLPDAWNKTKSSQKGRSDSTQNHTIA